MKILNQICNVVTTIWTYTKRKLGIFESVVMVHALSTMNDYEELLDLYVTEYTLVESAVGKVVIVLDESKYKWYHIIRHINLRTCKRVIDKSKPVGIDVSFTLR